MRSFRSKSGAAVLSLLLSAGLVGGYLFKEQHRAPLEVERSRLAQLIPMSSLYLLEREGQPVGFHRLTITPVDSPGQPRRLHVLEEAELRIPVPGGGEQHARQESSQLLDEHLRLSRWQFLVRAGTPGQANQSTRIEGERPTLLSDSMRVSVETGGSRRSLMMFVGPDVVLGSGLWPRLLLSGGLKEGAQVRLREMDPTSLALRAMEVSIGRRQLLSADSARPQDDPLYGTAEGAMPAFRVRQMVGGMTYQLWISEMGLPLRATLPLDVRARPAAAHEVVALARTWNSAPRTSSYAAASSGTDRSLIAQSAIAAGATVARARDLSGMRLLSSGIALPVGAEGGVQSVRGDTVEIRRLGFPPAERTGYLLPTGEAKSRPPLPASLLPHLEAEPFIESDHPDILRTARRVAGGVEDPAEAVRRVSDFVHGHLKKRYTASLPSAVEALRGAEGDCNEHTVLATALLRALGVPARPVSGVAYVEGSFYFHAWVEVWLGGRWLPIDPTFGVAPADPARLRLFIGREQMNSVLPMVGRLQLKVLSSTPS